MKTFVLGAGGHAKVVADVLVREGLHEVCGFTDADAGRRRSTVLGRPVLGTDDDLIEMMEGGPFGAILGVGGIGLRRRLLELFSRTGAVWVNALHPAACIAESASLGEGIVAMAGSVVNPDAVVGDHAILNTNCSVDHDCVLGENVHIAPGVAIGGSCKIGRDTLIGLGARVLPEVSIGPGCVVGGGSVVIKDVPGGTVFVAFRDLQAGRPVPGGGRG